MGRETGIEWTDATWNPIRGCSRVSEGCRNCYAERVAARFSGPGRPYEGLVDDKGRWNGKIRIIDEHLTDPIAWRKPSLIFVNSMSDLFHEGMSIENIAWIFGVMAVADRHIFQVLTKRAHRLPRVLNDKEFRRQVARAAYRHAYPSKGADDLAMSIEVGERWPLPNVWVGTSIERQREADDRVSDLLRATAALHFVSAEPLIGGLDITPWLPDPGLRSRTMSDWRGGAGLGWVIVGGESQTGSRPMNADWVRKVRDDCARARVPFYFKQWGDWLTVTGGTREERNEREIAIQANDPVSYVWPDNSVSYRVGKKAAGHLLDGKEHRAMPPEAARVGR